MTKPQNKPKRLFLFAGYDRDGIIDEIHIPVYVDCLHFLLVGADKHRLRLLLQYMLNFMEQREPRDQGSGWQRYLEVRRGGCKGSVAAARPLRIGAR